VFAHGLRPFKILSNVSSEVERNPSLKLRNCRPLLRIVKMIEFHGVLKL